MKRSDRPDHDHDHPIIPAYFLGRPSRVYVERFAPTARRPRRAAA